MTLAFLFIECLRDQAESVKRSLCQLQGVSEAHSTANAPYDVIVKVEADDESRLRMVVSAVKEIAGIAAVLTAITYRRNNYF